VHFQEFISEFGTNTTTGLAQGAIYALFALGYTLVYGVLRLINFAHSEVFMLGSFAAIGMWGALGYTSNTPAPGVLLIIGLILAAIVAAATTSGVAAVLVELIAYRPLRRRNAPPLAFLITAIGVSTVISETVGVVFTHRNPVSAPTLIKPVTIITLGNTHILVQQVLLVGLALVMMLGLDRWVNGSRQGRAIRAVAQNADSAALMGVNKNRIISLVFLVGGLMAGVAAVMYVLKIGNTKYDAGFVLGIEAFTAAVLGGIGNLRGALIGGLLLGVVENYGASLFGTQYHNVVGFAILILILMFRPTGILGESLGRARA